MSLLTRSDLQGKYNWKADGGDDPSFRGGSDKALLDRTEGYEVLDFINKLSDEWKFTQKPDGLKIEKMIHTTPSKLRSHEHIKTWIVSNWKTFA